jgi:hypothetical protein
MAEGKVTLVFEGKLGLPSLPPRAFDATETVGGVIDRIKKSKNVAIAPPQQLLLFVTSGADAFMPAPDQPIGDLFRMFGSDVAQVGKALKVAYCTQVYQG